MHFVDTHGFVGVNDECVTLRLDKQPYISVRSLDATTSFDVVHVAENAPAPDGAKPRGVSPGPIGCEGRLKTLSSTFPVQELIGYERPIISADGMAWREIDQRLRENGGTCILRPGWSIDVMAWSAGCSADDSAQIDVVIYDGAAGASDVIVATTVKAWGGWDPSANWSCRFEGLEEPARGVAVLSSGRGGALARGKATTEAAEEGVIELTVQCIGEAEAVEGFIEFGDVRVCDAVEGLSLFTLEPSAVLAHKLGVAIADFRREGIGQTIHWRASALPTGEYALLLEPLAIYLYLNVADSGGGAQAAYSYVAASCSNEISILSNESSSWGGAAKLRSATFVGDFGDLRPMLLKTRAIEARVGGEPVVLAQPCGATVRLMANLGMARGQTEIVSGVGRKTALELREPGISVPVAVRADGRSIERPLAWWQRHLRLRDAGGKSLELLIAVPPQAAGSHPLEFGAWGTRGPSMTFAVVLVEVPQSGAFLELLCGYESPGLESQSRYLGPSSEVAEFDMAIEP